MKRTAALGWIRIAGYHGDKASFTRLYIENRVSRAAADAAWRSGANARNAGVPCNCSECRAIVTP